MYEGDIAEVAGISELEPAPLKFFVTVVESVWLFELTTELLFDVLRLPS